MLAALADAFGCSSVIRLVHEVPVAGASGEPAGFHDVVAAAEHAGESAVVQEQDVGERGVRHPVEPGEFGHDVVELDDDFGVGGPAVGDELEVGGVPLAHDGDPFGQGGQGGGPGVGVQRGPAGGGRSFGVASGLGGQVAGYLVDPGGQVAYGGFPQTPKMSVTTELSLMQGSSSSFSARCFSAVRAATRPAR